MNNNEDKNAFAVISSLILERGNKTFPRPFSIDDNFFLLAKKYGLSDIIESNKDLINDTITWLRLDKYLHAVSDTSWLLAEKSFKDVEFRIPSPSMKYQFFTRYDNGEVFFSGKDDHGFNADIKLKLQGVAKRFIYDLPE